MNGFDRIAKEIKNNKPTEELYFSFKDAMNDNKQMRKELKSEIKRYKYKEILIIREKVEKECYLSMKNTTDEYFMEQLYKKPLVGFKINVMFGDNEMDGCIIHESKNMIYFVTENDDVKMFNKQNKNFIICLYDKKYLVIGEYLKIGRLIL